MTASKFAAKHTTVSAANQAALKDLQAKAAKPKAAKLEPDKLIVDPVVDEAVREFAETLDATIPLPSGTRLLISTIAGVVGYGTTIYMVTPVVVWLAGAAMALTGWMFLSYVIGLVAWAIGVFFSLYVGMKAFSTTFDVDFDRVASTGRTLREAAKRRVSLVRGWFKRSDYIVV
jgi:Zn-dependent protease with chaperone function